MIKGAQLKKGGLVDDFDFTLVSSFPGYNSAFDKTNLAPGFLIHGSKNVYKKLSGTIASRPGLKLRGAVDATLAGVNSSWEWNTSLGKTLPLRIANGNLQVESDIVTSGTPVWYTLLSGLATTRWVFDAWWDNSGTNNGQAKKDVLLMVDGTSTLRNWSGGIALFVSYVGNVITLDRNAATAGFDSSGSVLVNGVTYTYSGVSGSTLTGTSDASAAVANQPVLQVPVSNSNQPASGFLTGFIKVINNQVYAGSYTSRIVYISKNTTYLDYTQGTPRIPGDGDTLTLDNNATAITVRQGSPWISAGTSDWYEVTFSQITVGSTLSEQVKVDKKPTSTLSAALGHEFVDTVGDTIIALCQDHQVRVISTFANQFEAKYPSLSLAVKNELVDEDFTGGHLRAIGDIIYLSAPLSGRDWMHETRESINPLGQIATERFWHPPQVRNIARFAVIASIVYGHSNSFPQLYQVWDTMQWHDDSPLSTTAGVLYNCVMRMAYENGGRRQGKNNFNKTYFEGYITQGTPLMGNVYFDYQGSTAISNLDLNSAGKIPIFLGNNAPSLGDGSLGDNPLGDGLTIESNDQELLAKFRVIKDVSPTDNYEFALEVYTEAPDTRWEILALGTNIQISDKQAVEIRQ